MSSDDLFKAEHAITEMLNTLDDTSSDGEYAQIAASAYDAIETHTSSSSSFRLSARALVESHLPAGTRANQLAGVLRSLCDSAREYGYYSPINEKECYESHSSHSAALRNWFIAYGIGVPAILMTHESLLARIAEGGNGIFITTLFLGGVFLQVLKAILYRSASWAMIDYAYKSEKEVTRYMRSMKAINDSVPLDIGIDVMTLALFIAATVLALRAVSATVGSIAM